jgi:hypothetical protein
MIYIDVFDWVVDCFGCCSSVSTIITNIVSWICLTKPTVTEEVDISKDGNASVYKAYSSWF